MVVLRTQLLEDLPLLNGGASPFDDFGPSQPRTVPAGCDLEEHGALTVTTDDGEVAGEVSWHWQPRRWGPNLGSSCPMIGIWLRPSHRSRGLGTVAQRQLVELLFAHTTAHRVEAHTDVENLAEQRSLEKAGLLREGVVRGGQWRDGGYRDGVLYAVLRTDLAPVS
ncbi:GNAT family N-acetyltransferase [Streptomyces sp. NP160]|uniref:GNAT family N-acetyltransferase n=1 Tax=Streptomyces sp. NP160 TaxID=2586637 RepID=UPI00111AB863|nr:GNAT family protein [Streptomyces sp. NP160]TNM70260.1 GNAT family N-acetyltransferase [Streptomyces sp. NP160]